MLKQIASGRVAIRTQSSHERGPVSTDPKAINRTGTLDKYFFAGNLTADLSQAMVSQR